MKNIMTINMKKFLAGLLAGTLLITSVVPSSVLANDVNPAVETNKKNDIEDIGSVNESEEVGSTDESESADATEKEEQQEPQDIANDVQNNEQIFFEENPVEDSQEVESAKGESLLEYLYVESPYLEAPAEENLVLSWGDGTEAISKVELLYQRDGREGSFEMENKGEGLYLCQKTFSDDESGVYTLTDIRVTESEQEYTYNLAEQGIKASFGVNEYYPGYEPVVADETSEHEEGVAVVSDEDVENSQAEEIVGEALKEVAGEYGQIMARSLKNARSNNGQIVVALDPGHCDKHAGAGGNGVREEIATLKIAQYCKAELEKYSGVKVYMTRTGAACPFPKATDNLHDIRERVKAAVGAGADIYVSIHLNTSTSTAANGAEVWYPDGNQTPNTVEPGRELAQKIQNELVSIGLGNRGAKETDNNFACMNEGGKYNLPAVIVEHAFMSNVNDVNKYLKTEAGLKSLGVADASGIAKYFELSIGEWKFVDGYWMWFSQGQYWKNSWISAGEDGWYWVDENGYRVTGWNTVGDCKYYFNTDGKMHIGWKEIEGKKYYFSNSGRFVTGISLIDGRIYEFSNEGVLIGEILQGWNKKVDTWYYMKSNGNYAIGWEVIGGYYYYFEDDGKMVTGWQSIGGQRYYFLEAGRMVTGWQEISGKKYYFLEAGRMVTGWQEISKKKYYFGKEGVMATGIVTIDGKQYEFASNGVYKGEVQNPEGWSQKDGIWYYVKSDGTYSVGWSIIGGYYYYFADAGEMLTGWQYIGGQKYYFLEAGRMVTGWQEISGKKYYFLEAGRMVTGWRKILGKTYYFNKDGSMVTGAVTIDGKEYEFDSNGVYSDGIQNQEGWIQEQGIWYYIKSDGNYAVSWNFIEGYYYYFAKDGKMLTGWQDIEGQRYYFLEAGRMVTGWQEISGKWFYFIKSGQMEREGVTSISGISNVTKEQLVSFYNRSKYQYPSSELKRGGAETLADFAQIYIEEAQKEGIRADVAFAQAMLETKYLQYGGDVSIGQFNFAGLGAVGNGVPGCSFPNVRIGVRAQIQHLKAYANKEELSQACVDERFKYVSRGSAPYVEWLGIQENPNTGGWAASARYGFLIVDMLKKI